MIEYHLTHKEQVCKVFQTKLTRDICFQQNAFSVCTQPQCKEAGLCLFLFRYCIILIFLLIYLLFKVLTNMLFGCFRFTFKAWIFLVFCQCVLLCVIKFSSENNADRLLSAKCSIFSSLVMVVSIRNKFHLNNTPRSL